MCAYAEASLQDKDLYNIFLLQKDDLAALTWLNLKHEAPFFMMHTGSFDSLNASFEREGNQGSSGQK